MKNLRLIWNLLDARQRRNGRILLVLILFGALLEMLGVGMVVPLIAMLSQKEWTSSVAVATHALPWIETLDRRTIILGLLCAVVLFFLCKNLFLALMSYLQTRYSFGVRERISHRLFSGYLHQPYAFHLQQNSARLIQTTTIEAEKISDGVLIPLLWILSEGLIVIALALFLFYMTSWTAVLALLLLGGGGVLFHRSLRKRVERWGELRQYHEGLRIQQIQQGLGGIKEVKLLGREREFLDAFDFYNQRSVRFSCNQVVVGYWPRLWIELLALLGLISVVGILFARGYSPDETLPVLGLFAAAAFRLAPSVNRIISALQTLRFNAPAIRVVAAELAAVPASALASAAPPTERGADLSLRSTLKIESVNYRYAHDGPWALRDISMDITAGQSIGIRGASGAGKSTLINVVLGLLPPLHGQILADGVDIFSDLRSWQTLIGYVPQEIYLTDDTLRRNVAFGLPEDQIDDVAVQRALDAAQLAGFVDALDDGVNALVGERGVRISGGQRQRIGIARALYHDPSILVLDEATSALDMETEESVMAAIRRLRGAKTILIVAHRLSALRGCDALFMLEKGRLDTVASGAG